MASKKKSLSKFKQWQQDTLRHITPLSDEQHHCNCCGTDFTGNYCPQCGQKAGIKRITWTSIGTSVMEIWGMGNRSFPYTLWQLLLRPGYLIADYIRGRRQVSFPPIKMLVFVALFVFIVTSIISPEEASNNTEGETMILDYAISYFEKHYDVGVLFSLSMLIIPTYFIFRFSPRCSYHTLPEGFFIQVFYSTITLLFILIISVFSSIFSNFDPETFNNNFFVDILLLILVLTSVIYRSYHQLFGYSHWSTLWRVIAVCVSAVITLATLVVIDSIAAKAKSSNSMLECLFYSVTPLLLGAVVIVAVSYFISRHTAKRRGNKPTTDNQ